MDSSDETRDLLAMAKEQWETKHWREYNRGDRLIPQIMADFATHVSRSREAERFIVVRVGSPGHDARQHAMAKAMFPIREEGAYWLVLEREDVQPAAEVREERPRCKDWCGTERDEPGTLNYCTNECGRAERPLNPEPAKPAYVCDLCGSVTDTLEGSQESGPPENFWACGKCASGLTPESRAALMADTVEAGGCETPCKQDPCSGDHDTPEWKHRPRDTVGLSWIGKTDWDGTKLGAKDSSDCQSTSGEAPKVEAPISDARIDELLAQGTRAAEAARRGVGGPQSSAGPSASTDVASVEQPAAPPGFRVVGRSGPGVPQLEKQWTRLRGNGTYPASSSVVEGGRGWMAWERGEFDILEPLPAATPDPAVTRDAAQTLAEVVRLKDERIAELEARLFESENSRAASHDEKKRMVGELMAERDAAIQSALTEARLANAKVLAERERIAYEIDHMVVDGVDGLRTKNAIVARIRGGEAAPK